MYCIGRGEKMPNRKLPPNKELIEMYDLGMSCGEIAEKCNVKPVTVNSLFRRIGFKLRDAEEYNRLRSKRGRFRPAKYWQGKKQPPEMVEKRVAPIRGENHYLWKGGESLRPYRGKLIKEKCSNCGSKLNLCIHHKNLDHYDDRTDNLQVLCVSCHMSIHKKAYWDAYHKGDKLPKSNSPIGWKR
jgi:hypothetical protein